MGLIRWPAKPAPPAPPDVLVSPEPTRRDLRDGTPRAAPAHQLQAAAVGPAEVADEPVEVLRPRP